MKQIKLSIPSIEYCRNKLSQIISLFPVDGRRSDGAVNLRFIHTLHSLVNLILNRVRRNNYGSINTRHTPTISFCLQGDRHKGNTGWQGVIQEHYPQAASGINTLRKALRLIEAIGGVIWESQGRHVQGLLHCNVKTLLLIEQACMVVIRPDYIAEQGASSGDEQLSEEFWDEIDEPQKPLNKRLKWLGLQVKRLFGDYLRKLDLPFMPDKQAIAHWDEQTKLNPASKPPPLEECIVVNSWVDDKWIF